MCIKSPTVSVVIVADRNCQYLLGTINSVRQQIFSDFEVLILCRGKSPGLVQWFDRQQDPRLRLFFSEDLNDAKMTNLGIKEARGEYIAFLRGGDLWQRHKLQKQVFCLDHYPGIGLIHSWLTSIDEGNKTKEKVLKRELSGWVEAEILERNYIAYSSAIVRRSCFDTVGLFDPQLSSTIDWDLWIRLSRHYQFMAIAESLVYCRHTQDKIPESWLEMEKDLQATIEKAFATAPKELQMLKNRSYACASLDLAWKVIKNFNPDPVIADHYCRQALEHSPPISLSPEFIKISLATMTLRYLKSDRYRRLLVSIQNLIVGLKILFQRFKILAHLLLNWMLEEEKTNGEEISDSPLKLEE